VFSLSDTRPDEVGIGGEGRGEEATYWLSTIGYWLFGHGTIGLSATPQSSLLPRASSHRLKMRAMSRHSSSQPLSVSPPTNPKRPGECSIWRRRARCKPMYTNLNRFTPSPRTFAPGVRWSSAGVQALACPLPFFPIAPFLKSVGNLSCITHQRYPIVQAS